MGKGRAGTTLTDQNRQPDVCWLTSSGDRSTMTADIEHYSKTRATADPETPGLILIVCLLTVLAALVLAFS